MTKKEELERLSKAAAQEDDDVRYYGGPTSTHRPARDAYHAALVQLHRTGQLVPAMPSGDEVEAVARALFVHEEGHPVGEATLNYWFSCDENSKGEDAHCKDTCDYLRGIARAAITTYEAVSGVAKMREALRAFHDGTLSRSETIARIDAALGEQP